MTKEKKFSQVPTHEKALQLMDWLHEHKAKNITALDLMGSTPLTDVVIIITASSARHARSLADSVLELCSKENFEFLHMEGYDSAQWVLTDLNDIIVHIFQESVREVYDLESLWHQAVPLEK